jgi:hypothetical protein
MKIKNLLLILVYILIFSSCSNDDDNTPKQIESEPEAIIEQTAVIKLITEGSSKIEFGDVVIDISTSQVFSIQNTGNSDLNITNIILPNNFTIDITSTTITSNEIKEFVVTFIPTDIFDYSNSISIESNATGGSNSITILGTGVSPIYDGTVYLHTQKEVDDFGKLGYTSITKALSISGSGGESTIVDLEPLNKIIKVGTLEVSRTTNLESLKGLENLNTIDFIQMVSNYSLTNIDALKSVTKLERINILGNPLLKHIDGFENLIEVTIFVRFIANDMLENIDGFSNLTHIGTDFKLSASPSIINLNGLSNLQSASAISINNNASLYDYCGIKELLTNDGANFGSYYNRYNPTKEEVINGLCSEEVPLGVYDGDLIIRYDSDMERFASREFHTVRGSLSLNGEDIINLDFLENLTTVNGSFSISNTSVTNLNGLENLTTIDGSFSINNNPLTNLNGLDNLAYVNQMYIRRNESLSDYCGLTSFIENGTINYTGEQRYVNENNLYNPTLEDLQNGQCTE